MIKAVLLDLDDTLIKSSPNDHFPVYLQALSEFASEGGPPEQFCTWVIESFGDAVASDDPKQVLAEKFFSRMTASSGIDEKRLGELLVSFYRDCYDVVRPFVKPQPGATELIDKLSDLGIRVVVATNPGLPRQAIAKRMEWGALSIDDPRIELVTSLENMHFGKPRPEYFEEIMLHLSLNPGEAVMVGDDIINDIRGAQVAGLPTFLVHESSNMVNSDSNFVPTAFGTFQDFIEMVTARKIDSLVTPPASQHTFMHRLTAFPAGIDQLLRSTSEEVLVCAPGDHEWSARDNICHLRDHEADEDRARLERVLSEPKPFLSANYDPWSHAHEYQDISAVEAFDQFAKERLSTVAWLRSLSPQDWAKPARHAIFGPTNFLEMVRFTTEHDLTHLRQIRAAIDLALSVCA